MSDLRELYQETILDHGKQPRNFEPMDDSSCRAHGHNPLCGDRLTVFIKARDGKIERVTFQGTGCAISMASASMMAEALEGLDLRDADRIFSRFHDLVTGQTDDDETLGKLRVFTGVREFPVRVKCATLAWHTLQAALDNERRNDETVTTE